MRHRGALVFALALFAALSSLTVPCAAENGSTTLLVEGRVLDGDGDPLAGAEVHLRAAPSIHQRALERLEARESDAWIRSARSDGDGSYRIEAPGPGLYELRVTARGHVPRETELAPLLADRRLDAVRLPRGREIELVVLDAAGDGVDGALVTSLAPLDRSRSFQWGLADRAFRTDADGRALMRIGEDLRRPYDRTLEVVVPGHAPATVDVSEAGRRFVARLDSGVERRLEVRGPQGGPQGQPMADVLVLLDRTRLPVGRTDDEGRLEVRLPARDTIELRLVTADGHYLIERALAAGSRETIRLELDAPSPLRGRVVDAVGGEPVAGAWVWPYAHPPGLVRSDEHGEFEIVPLAGVPLARAGATGYLPGADRTETGELRIELQPTARLVGRVVGLDEVGVAGVLVRVRPQMNRFGPRRSEARGSGGSARTDADGRFVLDTLAAGVTYEASVNAAGWAPAAKKVTALPDGSATEVEIVLQPGIEAEGWVVDEADEPVRGAVVELYESRSDTFSPVVRRGEDPGSLATAVTDAEGRFAVRDLAEGAYRLEVDAAGFAPGRVPGVAVERPSTPDAPPADLGTVVLFPGVEIRGVVVDADEVPLAGVSIHCKPSESFVFSSSREPSPADATTDEDGRFVVRELVPGQTHEIVARLEGMAEARLGGVVPSEGSEETVEIVLQRSASANGRVIDEADAPVAGAHVSVEQIENRGMVSSQRRIGQATTDADGRFWIEDLRPGTVSIVAELEGKMSAHIPKRVLEPGQSLEGLELRLKEGLALTVRVVDGDGLPVEEAMVMAEPESRPRWQRPQMGTTDAAGIARMEGLPDGRIRVRADHRDKGRGQASLSLSADDTAEPEVRVRLDGGSEISGQVVSAEGAPEAGARVWIGRGALGQAASETASDAEGRFRLDAVGAGAQNLYAEKDGAGRAHLEVEMTTEPMADVILRLQPTIDVTGRLLGLDFDQVAAAGVLALGPGGARRGIVQHDGSYRVEGLAPGTWVVVAESGRRSASERVQLEAGEAERQVDLDFGQGSESLEGHVTLDGRDLEGAFVRLLYEAGPKTTTTNYRGRFVLEGLEPGSGRLEVHHRGARQEIAVEIPGAEPVEVDLQLASVEGRVVTEDGRPLAGVRLQAERLEDSGEVVTLGPTPWTAVPETDEDGRFRIDELSDGAWRLSATKDGFAQEDRGIEIAGGADVGGVEIVLRPTRGLWMDLRFPGSAPREVGIVRLDGSGGVRSQLEISPSEDGSVHLPSVPAGTWRFQVAAPGLATRSLVAEAPGDRPTVTLQQQSTVSVVSDSEAPVLELRLVHLDGAPHHFFARGSLRTRALPSIDHPRIEGVPAGRFQLVLRLGDGTRQTKEIDVPAGRDVEISLP